MFERRQLGNLLSPISGMIFLVPGPGLVGE